MKRGRFGTAALNSVVLLLLLLPFAPGELRRDMLQHYRSNATAWLDWLRIIGVVALVLRNTVWPPTRLQALLLMTAAVYGTWDSAEEEEEEEEGAALDEEGSRQCRHWHWWWRCVMARTAGGDAAEAFPGGAAAVLRVVASLSRIWRPVPYVALLPLLLLAAAGAAGDVVFRMPSGVAAHVNAMSEVAHRCWRCVQSMALWLAPRVLPYVALGAAVGGAAAAEPTEGAHRLLWGACWAATRVAYSLDADGRPMWRMLRLAAGALRIRLQRAWQRRWRTDSDRSQIFIRTLHGRTVALMVDLARPAVELLLEPAVSEGAPLYLLRLLRGGRSVRPDWSLLRGGVLPGSTLFVTSVLFGGVDFTAAERDAVCAAAVEQQPGVMAELTEAAFPEDMDAETRAALRAVAELMHVAEDPAQQEALEAWDEREWRTLTAQITQICAGVKDPESSAAKQACDDVCAAQEFRAAMAAALPQHVCAVCSRRCRQAEMQQVALSQLRTWLDQHLDASLPPNEEVPRNSTTRWVPPTAVEVQELLAAGQGGTCKDEAAATGQPRSDEEERRAYFLQAHPAAKCVELRADGDHLLSVCLGCRQEWRRGAMPALSLACVDNGARPKVWDGACWAELEQLTAVEERLLAIWRPLRQVVVCRPPSASAAEEAHVKLRAHVVAFKAPTLQQLASVFPCHPDQVPDLISVVFVSPAQTPAEVAALARRTPALHVRGKVVARWARHLAGVYGMTADERAVAAWEQHGDEGGVPPSLLQTAVAATLAEEADALLRLLRADQEGYARTRYGTEEEAAARSGGGSSAPPAQASGGSGAGSAQRAVKQQRMAQEAAQTPQSPAPPPVQGEVAPPAAVEQHPQLEDVLARLAAEDARVVLVHLEAVPRPQWTPAARRILQLVPGVRFGRFAKQQHEAPAVKERRLADFIGRHGLDFKQVVKDRLRALETVAAAATGAVRQVAAASAVAPAAAAVMPVVQRAAVPATGAGTAPVGIPEQALLVAEVQSAVPPSTAPRAYGAAPPSGPMYGVDDVDLITTATQPAQLATVFREAAGNPTAIVKLLQGWPLVTSTASRPESDYDPMWPLFVHVGRFPNGTGARPLGMSFLAWIRLQLQRWYPPLGSGAEDESAHAPHFILDMFDAWQRHEVHRSAAVRLKLYPRLIQQLGLMDVGMLLQTSDLLAAGLSRAQLAERLRSAPPAVGKLVQAAHMTAARVVGTPALYASLRSRAYGLWSVFGAPTASFTLNPASVSSEAAFSLMGRPYSFDVKGEPIGRPTASERWHLVAAHPLSCAESFSALISAFCDVFFGLCPRAKWRRS
ncbi:hypothetical protein GPECTOR_641g751 [Gonium pectorale]|uniref:Ubiquitin-like domain-containing protein n=1 Tax=Gonium pectorale TaxID=33097 RepID=A0A150FW12_GONPE|nr:hypothetical protein GPECTOR_641g751 [Gonium pectorale]|eukprot:KXZ41220.1 hypothetical protein GPECTOR_641g751 [Gonium pectorale]